MNKFMYLLPLAGLMAACSPQTYVKKDSVVLGHGKKSETKEATVSTVTITDTKKPMGMMPNASAFRMTGDYAGNVAITLGADGNVTYYPAPSDITAASVPESLGNGWYLNNQGISGNSVFTKYTFGEYSRLPSAPSPQQMKEAVIPGAHVDAIISLPFTISEAKDNIDGVKDYIKTLGE